MPGIKFQVTFGMITCFVQILVTKGLTPQFTLFPSQYKILSPSEDMGRTKRGFFILKYKPVLNELKLG